MQNGQGITVESFVPGRLRVRVPKELRNESSVYDLVSLVEGVSGLHRIDANAKTGGILIQYDPKLLDINQLMAMGTAAGVIGDIELPKSETQATNIVTNWPDVGQTARVILNGMKRVDQGVHNATNGVWDAKTLIPVGLLTLALVRALRTGKNSPIPWYTLIWYGYSSFMHWHSPVRKSSPPTQT